MERRADETDETLPEVITSVLAEHPAELGLLFGSHARGETHGEALSTSRSFSTASSPVIPGTTTPCSD